MSISEQKEDVIRVKAEDLPTQCQDQSNADQFCAIKISVTSADTYEESKFTISATRDVEGKLHQLHNGVPQKDTVNAGEWRYYYFKTSNASEVYAVLVPMYGDPDLYI